MRNFLLILASVSIFAFIKSQFVSMSASRTTINLWTSDNLLEVTNGDTKISCVSKCVLNTACESIMYKKSTMECQLHNNAITNITLMDTSPGWEYYYLYPENCGNEDGYIFYRPLWKCYKVYPEVLPELNVTVINGICQKDGAVVLRITSQDDQTFFSKVADGITASEIFYMILIQGTDEQEEGIWRLDDGTEMSYVNWNTAQPDNATDQNIVAMFSLGDWRWHDLMYSDGFPNVVICEKLI